MLHVPNLSCTDIACIDISYTDNICSDKIRTVTIVVYRRKYERTNELKMKNEQIQDQQWLLDSISSSFWQTNA